MSLNTAAKTALAVLSFSLGGLVAYSSLQNTVKPISDTDLAQTSVMVTRMDGRSGGSGVILESDSKGSVVLTNAHVCGVVKNGGKLTTESQTASVVSYKVSEKHDLCLITTNTNLGLSTKVAKAGSAPFSAAIVSGHPSLYPTVITRGHFSKYMDVTILVDIRPCTDQELDSDLAMICMFLGGMPVLKQYEAQLISATIMPGSSGSPVFNDSGEIGGLVFAGSGELSYGLIVPQEYIANFLENELVNLKPQMPTNMIDVNDLLQRKRRKADVEKLFEECQKFETPQSVKELCTKLSSSIIR